MDDVDDEDGMRGLAEKEVETRNLVTVLLFAEFGAQFAVIH